MTNAIRIATGMCIALMGCSGAPATTDGGTPMTDAGSCAGARDGTPCGPGGVCVGQACIAASCGDGFVSGDEDCDDANTAANDGCENDCTFTCVDAARCDDGDPCNGSETCNANHQCAAGTRLADDASCSTASLPMGVCSAGRCAARCSATAPFGAPVPLAPFNTSFDDTDARLSDDELTIYFSRSDAVGYDLFFATRADRTEDFGAQMPIAGVNDAGTQRAPTVTADGLFLYAWTEDTASIAHVSVATRPDLATDFSALALVDFSGTTNDSRPYALPDHSAVYFESDRNAATYYDVYRASHRGGSFGTPVPANGVDLASAGFDGAAVVTPDELTIYYSSDRAGGLGDRDIYVATRASATDPFGPSQNLAQLNTTGRDHPTWISADGCILVLTQHPLPDPTGVGFEILTATRGR